MTDPLPPHDLDAERYLLECFTVWPERAAAAVVGFDVDDLYDPANRILLRTMLGLIAEGAKPDSLTLLHVLEQSGDLGRIGGKAKVVEVLEGSASPANAERCVRIISDHARKRDLLALSADLPAMVNGATDATGVSADVLSRVQQIVDRSNRNVNLHRVGEFVNEHLDLIERRVLGEVEGMGTGWHDLDEVIRLRDGDLDIIGARPSMGKSMAGLNLAEYIAEHHGPALFVSLEMSRTSLLDRLYAKAGPTDHKRLTLGRLDSRDMAAVAHATTRLAKLPVYLIEAPALTMDDIHARARRIVGLRLVVVDYLQMVTVRHGVNRTEGVGEITRKAKLMAADLGCPVVVLSQLSREVEKRLDKRPIASDLRDSGEIEQHADVILFLYREEAYEPDSSKKGVVEVIVDKNRTGESKKTVELAFLPHQARIANMATAAPREPYRD